VKDPERTIPRATIIGTATAAILYLVATLALFGMVSSSALAESTSPFADGANVIFGGTWGGKAIAIVAMISIFGVLNGWILLQGRAPLGAARDGLFPRPFARVDGKRGTPVFGLVLSSVLITGLLLLNLQSSGTIVDWFTDIIIIATLTALIPYMLAAAASCTSSSPTERRSRACTSPATRWSRSSRSPTRRGRSGGPVPIRSGRGSCC
jgi:APA family basic amino acid/polyamine antiporter